MSKSIPATLLNLAVLVLCSMPASAAIDYHDSFTGYGASPPDMPTGWTEKVPDVFLKSTEIGGTHYTHAETASGDISGNIAYEGAGAYGWGDYTARAIGIMFMGGSATNSMSLALLTRVQSADWKQNYGAYVTGGGKFGIGKNFDGYSGSAGVDTSLTETTFTPVPSGSNANARPYMIEFCIQGDTLTATLYQSATYENAGGWSSLLADEGDRYSTFTEELASVSTTDSSYSTGSIGLNTSHSGGSRYFRMMEVSAVPEPATLSVLAMGAVFFRRRR